MTMHSREYTEHINSPEWADIRRDKLAESGYRCERCGAAGYLEVHHLTYDNLGNESPDDLEVLCKPCHDDADEERRWTARVNAWAAKRYGDDWDFDHDSADVEQEFEDWLERRGYA